MPPKNPQSNQRPVFLLSDSTCRVKTAKRTRQIDYTSAGDGFGDKFNTEHPYHYLVAGVWSGGKVRHLVELAKRMPAGAGCVLAVWMGNDYDDWHSSRQNIIDKFDELVELLDQKSSDVRMQLLGNPKWWKYGAAFDKFVEGTTAAIQRKKYPASVTLEYGVELEQMNFQLNQELAHRRAGRP